MVLSGLEVKEDVKKVGEENPPVLTHLLGDSAIIKLLDFLVANRWIDYSKSDIARMSGIGWQTLYRSWGTLEKYDLVKFTRNIGRAQLYKFNEESPIAKSLARLALDVADKKNMVQKAPSLGTAAAIEGWIKKRPLRAGLRKGRKPNEQY